MTFAPVATLIRLVVVGLNDNWPRPRTINSPRLRLGLLIVLGRGQLSLLIRQPPGGLMVNPTINPPAHKRINGLCIISQKYCPTPNYMLVATKN